MDNERNTSNNIPGMVQSNQTGEIYAIQTAAAQIKEGILHLKSDSRYAIEGLTKHFARWDDIGWIRVKNGPRIRLARKSIEARKGPTGFEWVKGHNGEEGNEEADKLAKEGANVQRTTQPDDAFGAGRWKFGARLTTMMQLLLYKGV